MSADSHDFRFRHSHGGTGCGLAHNPFLASRASLSNPFSTVFPGAYFRYHQHHQSVQCRGREQFGKCIKEDRLRGLGWRIVCEFNA